MRMVVCFRPHVHMQTRNATIYAAKLSVFIELGHRVGLRELNSPAYCLHAQPTWLSRVVRCVIKRLMPVIHFDVRHLVAESLRKASQCLNETERRC